MPQLVCKRGRPGRNLRDDSDRPRVFVPVRQLRGVVQDQHRRFSASCKSLQRGYKMPSQNIPFTDPFIPEKAIRRLVFAQSLDAKDVVVST
jgi:hypothetical protein